MSNAPLSTASRYGVALLSVTLALIVRLLLHPPLDTDAPLLLFTLSVMVSAWYGGYGPGVFSTLLGAVIGSHLFLEPIYSLRIANTSDRVAVALFVLTGVMISVLSQALRSSRQRAEEQEKERARLLVSEREARRAAETANRAKDEFLATVSHELRTPLASMLMWVRMLDSGKLDTETTEHARKTLVGNVKTLSQRINDLLENAGVGQGATFTIELPLSTVQLRDEDFGMRSETADSRKESLREKSNAAASSNWREKSR